MNSQTVATHRFTCKACGVSFVARFDTAVHTWRDSDWYCCGKVYEVTPLGGESPPKQSQTEDLCFGWNH